MKKLTSLFLLLPLIACGPAEITTPTVAPSPSSTPAPMATSTPITNVPIEQCAEILPDFPERSAPPGILVVHSPGELVLLNFRQQTQRTIPGLFEGVGTSPNGKWLSYIVVTSEHLELIVESADGQKQAQLPFNSQAMIFDSIPWLDNERIWYPIWAGVDSSMDEYTMYNPPTVVLNPFTGERQVLLPDYPDFAPNIMYGFNKAIRLYFGSANVAYDPSLRYVVYAKFINDEYYLVLWDREFKQELAEIPDTGFFQRLPIWLPDGIAFLAVVTYPDGNNLDEWFMVSRDGEVRQLTHFGGGIGLNASLSPDGHYLAFGGFQHDPFTRMDLIILNLQTLKAVNTCIKFDYPSPIWSPDNQYLAVQSWDAEKKQSFVAVVNPNQGWAVKVSDGTRIIPALFLLNGT